MTSFSSTYTSGKGTTLKRSLPMKVLSTYSNLNHVFITTCLRIQLLVPSPVNQLGCHVRLANDSFSLYTISLKRLL